MKKEKPQSITIEVQNLKRNLQLYANKFDNLEKNRQLSRNIQSPKQTKKRQFEQTAH